MGGLLQERAQTVLCGAHEGEVCGDGDGMFAFEAARDLEGLVARAAAGAVGAGSKRSIVFDQFLKVLEQVRLPLGGLRREELVGQAKPAVRVYVTKLR